MHTIQRWVKPSSAMHFEAIDLYVRGQSSFQRTLLIVYALTKVTTNTYFNSFSAGKWYKYSVVEGVRLQIRISSGRGQLYFWHQGLYGLPKLLDVPRDFDGPEDVAIDFRLSEINTGIVYWELRAHSEVLVESANYISFDPAPRTICLAAIVTAFKRDQEVMNTIERIRESPLIEQGHRLIVIDNGQTLPAGQHEWGEIISNENLGGAGGFSRGLMEVRSRTDFTHALLMDDDASNHIESIERTICILSYAKNPALAIAGSMLTSEEPWIQHEAGAKFKNYGVEPIGHLKDLRDASNVVQNERGELVEYGAWWFFALPLANVRSLAFPFFVRGDDQQFSRENSFQTITLNGVGAWQSRFDDKITPTVEYLQTRSEYLIGLLRSKRSLWSLLNVVLRASYQISREAMNFRYEIADARCDALEDVFVGPDFWKEQANAIPRLTLLKRLYASNYPHDVSASIANAAPLDLHRPTLARKLLMYMTLGGHLIPNVLLKRQHVMFPALYPCNKGCLRRGVIYYSPRLDAGYLASKSVSKFVRVNMRLVGLIIKAVVQSGSLRQRYDKELPYLQSREFWRKTLRLDVGIEPGANDRLNTSAARPT